MKILLYIICFIFAANLYAESTFEETGEALPLKEVHISSKVVARILKIHKTKGQPIHKGDLLIELDGKDILAKIEKKKQEINVMKARVKMATLKIDEAQKELKRYSDLWKKGSSTEQVYDHKKTLKDLTIVEREILEAQIHEKKAELKELHILYDEYLIKSPTDGLVLDDLEISAGRLIQPGQPLLHIADISSIKIHSCIPSRYWHRLKLNQTVKLKLDGIQNKIEGKVSWISDFIETNTRTKKVEIILKNPKNHRRYLLAPGMFARVEFLP